MHIVWHTIICWFKKKVPVWIFFGRGYKLFIIPQHVVCLISLNFSSLCRFQLSKRYTHAVKQYLQISLLLYFISTDIGRYLEISHSFIHIHTQRELYIYWSDRKCRILHSAPLLKFLTDLLTNSAVNAPKCAILWRAADLKTLSHRATP